MTQFELDCKASLMREAQEISKQLRIANKLKVLELKIKYPAATSMADDLLDEIE